MKPNGAVKHDQSEEDDAADDGRIFLGVEHLNGPAKGLLTLFVVGKVRLLKLVEAIDEVHQEIDYPPAKHLHLSHLHFGANGSFDGIDLARWGDTIKHFLREGFWCSLEVRPKQLPLLLKSELCGHARFIPVVALPIPHAMNLGQNLTLLIQELWDDDSPTNPGTWSVSLAGILHQRSNLVERSAAGDRIVIIRKGDQ